MLKDKGQGRSERATETFIYDIMPLKMFLEGPLYTYMDI